MSNIPDKCSRCGAPIDWDKGVSSTKCSFCGKINYIKNDIFNSFISSINSIKPKKLLLNPISIFLIILLPLIFSRFILQANKYKRFDNAYLAKKTCEQDLKKLSNKYTKARCDESAEKIIRLIYEVKEEKEYKISKASKSLLKKKFFETSLPSSIYFRNVNNKRPQFKACNFTNEDYLHKKYIKEIEEKQKFAMSYADNTYNIYINFSNHIYVNLEDEGYPWNYTNAKNKRVELLQFLIIKKRSYKRLKKSNFFTFDRDRHFARSKDLENNEISKYELLKIKQQQIKWLEDFLKKENNKIAFKKVREIRIEETGDCVESIRSKDISKIRSVFSSIPSMIQCEEYKSNQLKKNSDVDVSNISIICDHPIFDDKSYSLVGHRTSFRNLNKDIVLKINIEIIKKYYLY